MSTSFEHSPVGKFTPLPKEIMAVRQEAIKAMLDPDVAEQSFREKIKKANTSIKIAKMEKAIKPLREYAERVFGAQNN